MSMIPLDMPDIRCVFCTSEREINPRCSNCGKLLAEVLSGPAAIRCPRCKVRHTVGPCDPREKNSRRHSGSLACKR